MVDVNNILIDEIYTLLAMETNRMESEFNVIFYSPEFAETIAALCCKYYLLFLDDGLPF